MRAGAVVIAPWLVVTLAGGIAAQQAAPEAARSTLQGVYTTAQAAQGRDVYAGMCQSCHTPASYTGPAFLDAWSGRALEDLFGYIRARMPKSEPGSLTPREYAQVVAYLLELNGMPAGRDELPSDPAALKVIRFEAASTRPGNLLDR
jgi:mono/diheme cytochrome c family protein